MHVPFHVLYIQFGVEECGFILWDIFHFICLFLLRIGDMCARDKNLNIIYTKNRKRTSFLHWTKNHIFQSISKKKLLVMKLLFCHVVLRCVLLFNLVFTLYGCICLVFIHLLRIKPNFNLVAKPVSRYFCAIFLISIWG